MTFLFKSLIYNVLICNRQGAINVGPVMERLWRKNINIGIRAVLKRDKFNLEIFKLLLWRFAKNQEIFRTLKIWFPLGWRHPNGVTAVFRQTGHGQA